MRRFPVSLRRALAGSMALLFTLQSAGSAVAYTSLTVSQHVTPLSMQIASFLQSLRAMHIGVILSGDGSRWAAMHAPPPSPARRALPDPTSPPTSGGVQPIPVMPTVFITPLRAHPTLAAPPRFVIRPLPPRSTNPNRALHNRMLDVALSTNSSSPGTTGINRWWTYAEDNIPGSGRYMVNVANNNLIVQDDDMDIPNKGIDLAFRRTYNSQSQHDYANTDGSVPSNYGDGWTNTWDAHVATNSSGGVSVFDIDGARYDYTGSDSTGWTSATAGQHATLTLDSTPGLYDWTKKSGTVYVFYKPSFATVGEAGRLNSILGRNHNNSIQFAYTFAPDTSSPRNISTITATTEAQQSAKLTFGDVTYNSVTYRLLSTLTYPDKTTVTYAYVSGTDLSYVLHPSNNSAGTQPKVAYGWNPGHQLNHVSSPRYEANTSDGAVFYFYYSTGTNAINQIDYKGVVNPSIADGTGLQLQSGYSQGLLVYKSIYYTQPSSMVTEIKDSDGHDAKYTYDSIGHITQTQEYTGEASPTYLVTTQVWDANNNLLETTDARGNATDYAYDSNGNTTAVALPSVTIGGATFRPTSLYSHDVYKGVNYNNVTSYCDAASNHSNNRDWNPGTSPTPSPAPCPTVTPAAVYNWDHVSNPSVEPFGRLSDTYTPLGYHVHITYDPTKQNNVDSSLPTTVQAATAISQNDGSQRTLLTPVEN